MSKSTGGNAYPATASQMDMGMEGMSLRDYFAAQALIALSRDLGLGAEPDPGPDSPWTWIAEQSYAIADDFLKARSK